MSQLVLFPDPRPLVERLGPDFFRQAPERPGVYLMQDAADCVLYVGKAKNLRKRLASYRVANPDRMKPRHLRLVRAVARIELEECPDESGALARESELLLALRPRFNRAGTWPGPRRFLGWRVMPEGLALAITTEVEPGWTCHGPFGAAAIYLRASLVRLLWAGVHPERGFANLPEGWFRGCRGTTVTISGGDGDQVAESERRLAALFAGAVEEFADWICQRTSNQSHPFELAARNEDLETLKKFPFRPGASP